MVKSKYEDDENLANRAYARFYASDSPSISSEQFPSGVFYYRNVNGLEDYQSYHEQSAGRSELVTRMTLQEMLSGVIWMW